MSFTGSKCSQQPSHLYSEMIAGAKKCLPFPGLCAFHSLPVCGSLFMREINGWETSAENSALFVCAIPATFHGSLVLYLSISFHCFHKIISCCSPVEAM